VALSSRGHLRSPVVFDDIMYENREYDPWEAYGQSKTANVLFAVEAAKRWAGDGITVNAVHPGVIQTNLSRHVSAESMGAVIRATGSHEKSIGQGAATSVLVATWPGLAGVSGMYFEDAQVAGPYVPPIREGVADYAIDPGNAERLWNVSEELLGQSRV
jgi:NAD(P)-dependent dehydrogenase (short-subunit alcohol dehydrogenase family)